MLSSPTSWRGSMNRFRKTEITHATKRRAASLGNPWHGNNQSVTDARDDFVRRLTLEQVDRDIFTGQCHAGAPQRAFGGQVAAQSLVARGPHGGRPRNGSSTHHTGTSCDPAAPQTRSSTRRPSPRWPIVPDPPRQSNPVRRNDLHDVGIVKKCTTRAPNTNYRCRTRRTQTPRALSLESRRAHTMHDASRPIADYLGMRFVG